ncbi:DUF2599 domain-containing protein [Amycolatopsis sp. NPDC058986]|uniref:DUF2599 domain-containing protein n=1 Tax=unclassified Amycolatopsis TaxID=2618356 RepID=UPI00366ECD9A
MRSPRTTRVCVAALLCATAALATAGTASAAPVSCGTPAPCRAHEQRSAKFYAHAPSTTSPDDVRTAGVVPVGPATALRTATGQAIVDHTEWLPDPKGPRLAVFPTEYGRRQAPASERLNAWNEVVKLAPAANHTNMRDQFLCHYDFARISEPDKPSWNLEQWRPDVGYTRTVLARCNPT